MATLQAEVNGVVRQCGVGPGKVFRGPNAERLLRAARASAVATCAGGNGSELYSAAPREPVCG